MQKYELVIKNEKIRTYNILFLFFILLNLGFLLANAIYASEKKVWTITGLCLFITTVGFGAEYFYKRRKKNYSGKGAAIIFILITYISLKLWLPIIAVVLVSLLYLVSIRQLIVNVDQNWITYPSFPKRQLEWGSLNNIILKDGILTIDFKNNKIAQAEVINSENDHDLNEKEFNEFCKQQLSIER